MFIKILIALYCLLIQPTIHHFVGKFDECTASNVCNHTWTPVCGHFEEESSSRIFLDDCDLHEFNCNNNTTYVEVDPNVCSAKCTQRDQADMAITPMLPTLPPPKVSTILTTEELLKTETIKNTCTKKVTETNIEKTDTSTTFVATTTLEMTTEETKTTNKTTSEITAKATAATTEATITTNVNTSTDVTTVKPVILTTTATELPTILSNINDDENTIPKETTRSTSDTIPENVKLECYPKRCTLPSTWETTSVSETRDFVQVLRERYGNRIKFLRDTTHFPKQPTYARKSEAFIPSYHIES